VEYAAVTERVARKVAHFEGSEDLERAYTLATEAFLQELGKVPVAGRVMVLREQRLDEKGRLSAPKSHSGVVGPGDALGTGGPEAGLTVEPVEGLQLLVKGQEWSISAIAAAPKAACSGRQTCI
jgi:fructose-1,6-bisphosphatase/sedoheptulose 1,7-bisphosphatase-like protein